jgi:hypothetical protein
VLAPTGAARAQSVGVVGGATLAEINASGDERANVVLTDKLEVAGGLFVAFPLGARASFEPEFLYNVKGSLLDSAGGEQRIRLVYVDVPFTFRVSPPPDSALHWLRMVAGPYAAYLLEASSRPTRGGTRIDLDDAFERIDWGWVAGAGVHVGRLDVDVRYNGGVADIGRRPSQVLLRPGDALKLRNRWFSFLGRFRF